MNIDEMSDERLHTECAKAMGWTGHLRDFPGDIMDAFVLVEHMGGKFHLDADYGCSQAQARWVAWFAHRSQSGGGDTPARAICRAFLKAKGGAK